MTDNQPIPSPNKVEWSAHVERLFRHAGTGVAAILLKQAVLQHRRPNSASSPQVEP